VQELMVKETIARAEWSLLWEQYGNTRVDEAVVEAKLREMWPELPRLTREIDSGPAILNGEYRVVS
jgi:hypothetical protein